MLGHLDPAALRLSASPLLAVIRQAARGRGLSLTGLLGDAGYRAYRRIRQAGTASLQQIEDLCDQLGCHPYELYRQDYQRLALAAVPGPLEPDVTVTAWHPASCDRPGCGRRIQPGEPVGLIGDVGACCAACCNLGPARGGGRVSELRTFSYGGGVQSTACPRPGVQPFRGCITANPGPITVEFAFPSLGFWCSHPR